MNRTELKEKANQLPLSPGVYIMKNRDGNIIYIGKSKVLRNRVGQYFSDTAKDSLKTEKMVSRVYDFDYMLTETEIEALALENKLIKQHKPKFNIRLKDSKSYPYIAMTAKEEFPRVYVTRTRKNDGAEYFGPYSGIKTAYTILNTAYSAFGIPNCKLKFPEDIGKRKPCIYYEMGRCSAPCAGKITSDEYKERISELKPFLRGNYSSVAKSVKEKMQFASENFRYEAAAVYRDSLRSLENLRERQKVVGKPGTDFDVFAVHDGKTASCLFCFSIRDGAIHDSIHHIFGANEIPDSDGIVSCISDVYEKSDFVPNNIYTSFDLGGESEILSAYIFDRTGKETKISTPKRGYIKALADTALENARQFVTEYEAEASADEEVLIKLAQMAKLEVVPERIEAYDISNLGNENIIGGMICLVNGKFSKPNYRLYKMRDVKTEDDYASMAETVKRRLLHPELDYPDLLLIDGGLGHVHVVQNVLDELGIEIPVLGMVKDEYHKTRALVNDEGEISISREQSVFVFIYKIQEEIHRFTVSKMMAGKRKTLKRSVLENIPGIGPGKAAKLLAHFSSLKNLSNASAEEIAKCPTVSAKDAERIAEYFRRKKEKEK